MDVQRGEAHSLEIRKENREGTKILFWAKLFPCGLENCTHMHKLGCGFCIELFGRGRRGKESWVEQTRQYQVQLNRKLHKCRARKSVIERPNLQWLCWKDLESLTVKVNLIIIRVYFPAHSLLTEEIIMLGRNQAFTLQITGDPNA